ncbi:MAG: DUF1761 domain-containing protein [Cytophagales bacterium]|nr:DUF1761 domain-containing protein [Cytophagales bacterium]
MNTLKMNHYAILVSFVLSFILGFLWYGPLFGEAWMRMVGLDEAMIEANPPGAGIWITNVLSSIIPLYVLAWLFIKLSVRSGIRGAGIGLLIAFSFDFLHRMTSDMFAQAPYELSWITGGFDMVLLTISGFLLGAWRKEVPASS